MNHIFLPLRFGDRKRGLMLTSFSFLYFLSGCSLLSYCWIFCNIFLVLEIWILWKHISGSSFPTTMPITKGVFSLQGLKSTENFVLFLSSIDTYTHIHISIHYLHWIVFIFHVSIFSLRSLNLFYFFGSTRIFLAFFSFTDSGFFSTESAPHCFCFKILPPCF